MLASFDFRHNAIGFLRLAFAALVLVSHAYPLGGFGEDPLARWNYGYWNLGNLAVGGFFVLSGFLIARSAERVGDVRRFLRHRFLRIFPAFWACLVVTVLFFGPLVAFVERGTLNGYFDAAVDPPWRYVVVNAALPILQHGVAGLLGHTPFRTSFDGPLWTLQFEFACYLGIAIFAAFGMIRRRRFAVLVLFASILAIVFGAVIAGQGSVPAPGPLRFLLESNWHLVADLAAFFFAGAVAYLYRDRIPLSRPIGIVATIVTVVAFGFPRLTPVLWVALPIAVLWLAAELPLRDVDRRFDLSYGLYIYAFPCQQLCAVLGVHHAGIVVFTLVPLLAALALAACSWFAIERGALAAKDAPWRPPHLSFMRRKAMRS